MAKIAELKQAGATVYPRTVGDAVAVGGQTLTDALAAVPKTWTGTEAEYEALAEYDEDTVYFVTG